MSFQREPAAISPRGMFNEVTPPGAQRFLLAAISAFAGRGYHASTTRHIALLAGSSPAGMYTYYACKADLLYEMSLITHKFVLGVMKDGLESGTDPAGRMAGLVKASVAFHAEEHVAVRVVNADFRALDVRRLAEIMHLRRKAKQLVVTELTNGVAAGVFTAPHVEGASVAILRLMDVASWYNERGLMSPMELGEVYSDLVLRMLGVILPVDGVAAVAHRDFGFEA